MVYVAQQVCTYLHMKLDVPEIMQRFPRWIRIFFVYCFVQPFVFVLAAAISRNPAERRNDLWFSADRKRSHSLRLALREDRSEIFSWSTTVKRTRFKLRVARESPYLGPWIAIEISNLLQEASPRALFSKRISWATHALDVARSKQLIICLVISISSIDSNNKNRCL